MPSALSLIYHPSLAHAWLSMILQYLNDSKNLEPEEAGSAGRNWFIGHFGKLYIMPKDSTTPVDRRALKVLFETYWTPAGWRDEQSRPISLDDFEYAKRAGVMSTSCCRMRILSAAQLLLSAYSWSCGCK